MPVTGTVRRALIDAGRSFILMFIDTTTTMTHMRLQLALNVVDLDKAVDFYSTMFGTEPARRRPGYANFAIAEPPLKLVLFEQPDGVDGDFHHLNHLGVEVERPEEVTVAERRLSGGGVQTTGVDDVACCYAEKTETWVESPDGARWEWYVRTGDAEHLEQRPIGAAATGDAGTCCG